MIIRHFSRILRRDSLGLIINTTGFSLGLAASILLAVFIQFELSFDRHFGNGSRIYRLNTLWISEGESSEMPINLREAYTEIPDITAGVEEAVQIYRGFGKEVVRKEERFRELDLLYADPGFFKIFDLAILSGSRSDALNAPGKVVLTEEIAQRIFGTPQATGETFTMEGELYTVSAVIRNVPPATHFSFDLLMPMESVPALESLGGLEFFTYYLLEEGVNHGPVLETIIRENNRILTDRFSMFEGSSFDSRLEPLRRLHLHTRASFDLTTPGSMKTIYIMLVITFAIMVLAFSNFINLYILSGARRSKEIGIRKVAGSDRRGLIRQFYLETTLVVTMAFLLAAILVLYLLPSFAGLMKRESFTDVTGTSGLYLILGIIYLLTILAAGFYPALLLSRADPVPLIRGAVNPAGDKRSLLRTVSVFQVCIAVTLLTILTGIHVQIRHLKNLSPGYKPDHMVLISNLNPELSGNFSAIRDQLNSRPGIAGVAASWHTIGSGTSGQGIRMYGSGPDDLQAVNEYRIQPGLCQLYRFELLAGRFLEPDRKPDRMGIILNEAAVEMLGMTPESIIGESVVMHDEPLTVTGVVGDFHYESAAREVEPLVLTAYSERFRNIAVRYMPGYDPREILRTIDREIRTFDPGYVMLHRYPAEIIEGYYTEEERLQQILLFGSGLSVLIVLLGIYALVSHQLVNRTKEIGIRKVMGGTTREMLRLIYTSTLRWTLLASVISIPLAYLYLRDWLNDYSVRIPLHWWIFLSSITAVVLFQSLVTLGQTRRTARRNPVEALRYE